MWRWKWFGMILISFTILVLVACSNGQTTNKANNETEEETLVSGKESAKLTETEMKQEIVRIISGIEIQMASIQENNKDWYGKEWLYNQDEDDEEYQRAYRIVEKELSPYLSKKAAKQNIPSLIEAYFCECDSYDKIEERDIAIRFSGKQLNKKTFETTSIRFTDYEGPQLGEGGTWELRFVNQDDVWKLDDRRFVPASKRALHVSEEEVYQNFNGGLDGVGTTVHNGKKYYIARNGDWSVAIHEKDTKDEPDVTE